VLKACPLLGHAFFLFPGTCIFFAMHTSFAGKKIVIGISGSIAAFKVAGWVSTLAKDEARVSVIMTESAKKFVTSLTFAALSGEKVFSEMFSPEEGPEISHISLGREADIPSDNPGKFSKTKRIELPDR